MALNIQNINKKKGKLLGCDTNSFKGTDSSFKMFINEIKINSFRHIDDLTISFEHPVTIISGTNKIGKTSILLLLACSHEKFMKLDASSPKPSLRSHNWNDVLSFTSHETVVKDYSYKLKWRVGMKPLEGEGKRLASSKAWSGLAKKSSDAKRKNAKIRDREVRFVDLERILPGRSFSTALFRKANSASKKRMNGDIEKAFSYIFDLTAVEIYEVGGHINKSCFIISNSTDEYSTFNAASGEESVINLLKDLFESPKGALILIDEMEAGFHPSVQRKLADIVQYISWDHKKQFIITTHSSTLLAAFPSKSRRFIEKNGDGYRVIKGISQQAARSKMDSIGHPLLHLYCEDDLAEFLIKKTLIRLTKQYPHFEKLVNIIKSGPINEVKNDYERHKRNIKQFRNKVGFCAVFDGDHKDHPPYSNLFENDNEKVIFLYPYDAPEKFLVRAYLNKNNHSELRSALEHNDHHSLFQTMVNHSLATDINDARGSCYNSFEEAPEYQKHYEDLSMFLIKVLKHFSNISD